MRIETLSDLLDNGYEMTGNCNGPNCGRGRALDIPKLIEQFGPDHVHINDTVIASRLKCDRCGHRGGVITISPPRRLAR